MRMNFFTPIDIAGCIKLFEEPVDSFTGFAFANPDDILSFKVVNNGGIFSPFAVRDFVDTNHFEFPDLMSFPLPSDNPV
jgi:hypothetical protein